MIDYILKLWFSIPHIKFRKPFIITKRDSRELEWFKERREFGFDEQTLWNLSHYLNEKIIKYHGIEPAVNYHDTVYCDLEQFKVWFNNDISGLIWLYDRINCYSNWGCPTFFRPDDINDTNLYVLEEESKIILKEILLKIKTRIEGKIIEGDAEYVEKYVFTLGW